MHQKQWEFGLFECFGDCKTCLTATCCPCVQYGLNQQRFANKESCVVDCCIAFCSIAWFWPIYACLECQLRADIRKRHGIEGSCPGDCCVTLCCAPCSQTQSHRELLHQEDQRNYQTQSQATIIQQPQMQVYQQGYQPVPVHQHQHGHHAPAIPPKY